MIRVLHSSDLHGKYKKLIVEHATTEFDVWVDSGDFCDTKGRVAKTGFAIDPDAERFHQIRWLGYKSLVTRFKEWLHGRPAIMVCGNHDFISFPHMLKAAGADIYIIITPAGVAVLGKTWAGFREINWMGGEWQGEVHDLSEIVASTLASNPDILVTHAPPAGIFDGHDGYGIRPLTAALAYSEHKVKAHLFGHCHTTPGVVEEMGITFSNAAGKAEIIEIP